MEWNGMVSNSFQRSVTSFKLGNGKQDIGCIGLEVGNDHSRALHQADLMNFVPFPRYTLGNISIWLNYPYCYILKTEPYVIIYIYTHFIIWVFYNPTVNINFNQAFGWIWYGKFNYLAINLIFLSICYILNKRLTILFYNWFLNFFVQSFFNFVFIAHPVFGLRLD